MNIPIGQTMSRKYYGLYLVVMMLSLFLSGQAFSQGTFVITDSAARLISSQRYELARSYLEDSIKVYPNDPQLFRLLGEAYWGLKNYPKAISSYNLAKEVQHCDTCSFDLEKIGEVYFEANEPDSALTYFKTASGKGTTNISLHIAQLYLNKGDSCYDENRLRTAIIYYQLGLEFLPDTILFQQLLLCYYKLGEFDSVIHMSNTAIGQFPGFEAARTLRAAVCKSKGKTEIQNRRYAEAIQDFNILSSSGSLYLYDSYTALGLCYDSLHEKELSVQYYEFAAELHPDSVQLFWSLEDLYRDQGCHPELIQAYVKGAESTTDSCTSCAQFSLALRELKDTALALQCIEQTSGWECDYVPVDKYPVPTHQVQPDYPEEAKRRGLSGTIWAKCLIGPDGNIIKVEIMKSDSEIFNSFVVAAASKWTFTPATVYGVPIQVWAAIPFHFVFNR